LRKQICFFQAFFLIFIGILGFWQVLSQWLSPFSQGSKQQDDIKKMVVNLKNINTSSKQQKHFMNKL